MWRRINKIFVSQMIGHSDRLTEYGTCAEAFEALKQTDNPAFLSYEFKSVTSTIHVVDGNSKMVENKMVFPDTDVTEHTGDLFGWFETGLEGVAWALQEDKQGYDGLQTIDCGNFLKIYNKDKELVWEGVIEPDIDRKVAGPYNVHWVQKGLDPKKWLEYFDDNHTGVVYKGRLTEEAYKRRAMEAKKLQDELWKKIEREGEE